MTKGTNVLIIILVRDVRMLTKDFTAAPQRLFPSGLLWQQFRHFRVRHGLLIRHVWPIILEQDRISSPNRTVILIRLI